MKLFFSDTLTDNTILVPFWKNTEVFEVDATKVSPPCAQIKVYSMNIFQKFW